MPDEGRDVRILRVIGEHADSVKYVCDHWNDKNSDTVNEKLAALEGTIEEMAEKTKILRKLIGG